jgi:hypothetical protein
LTIKIIGQVFDNLYFMSKNSLISKDRSALEKVGKTVPG